MPLNPLKKPSLQILGEKITTNFIKVLPSSVKTVPLGTRNLTPQQVVAEVQAGLDKFVAAEDAKAAAMAAVEARKVAEPSLRLLLAQLATFLKLVIGGDPTALASCGITLPKKRAQPTGAEAAMRAARNTATRAANGTRGTKQKQQAAKAARGTTVVLGADGQPLLGSVLPPGVTFTSTASVAAPAAGANTPAAPAVPGVPSLGK